MRGADLTFFVPCAEVTIDTLHARVTRIRATSLRGHRVGLLDVTGLMDVCVVVGLSEEPTPWITVRVATVNGCRRAWFRRTWAEAGAQQNRIVTVSPEGSVAIEDRIDSEGFESFDVSWRPGVCAAGAVVVEGNRPRDLNADIGRLAAGGDRRVSAKMRVATWSDAVVGLNGPASVANTTTWWTDFTEVGPRQRSVVHVFRLERDPHANSGATAPVAAVGSRPAASATISV